MVASPYGNLRKLRKALKEEMGEDAFIQFMKVPKNWKPPEGVEKYVVTPRGEYGMCFPIQVQNYPADIIEVNDNGAVTWADGVVLCNLIKFNGIERDRLEEILHECGMRFRPWPRRSMVCFSRKGAYPKDDKTRHAVDMTQAEIKRYYK